MATHNSARWVLRTLDSIDRALVGRRYALVVADDGSRDDTARIIRNAATQAEDRLIVALPKAPSVGESKNRAMRLARTFLPRYPWVAFMDDDDEMLSGRFTHLLEGMESEGQKAGVGDWLVDTGTDRWEHRGDWSIRERIHGPWATIIHRDLIPADGRYFVEVPSGLLEDFITHQRLARVRGVPWCYHGGAPVHVFNRRAGSATRNEEHARRMLADSSTFLARTTPETSTSIRSFCTVAYGVAVPEASLLLRTLRITGNTQPIVVITDEAGARVLRGLVDNVEVMVSEMDDSKFAGADRVYGKGTFNHAAILRKMDVISEAVRRHGSTLFLDADTVVLRRYHDVIREPIGICPELQRHAFPDPPPSTWLVAENFGHFNCGQVYVHRDARHVVDWWRDDYLKSWDQYKRDDLRHGCFNEQSSLDLFPLLSDVHVFHPGHNFVYTRVPRSPAIVPQYPEDFLSRMKLSVRHSIHFRGWPVMSLHAHFRAPTWAAHAVQVFRKLLTMSDDPVHREIASLVNLVNVASP